MSNQPCAKTCAGCGATFTPSSARQLHCDDACGNRARQRRHKANLKRETIVVDEVAAGRLDPIDALDWMTDPEGARNAYEARGEERDPFDELAWLSLLDRVYDRWAIHPRPAYEQAPRVMSSTQLVERLDVLARIGARRLATRGARPGEYTQLAKGWRAEQRRRRDATDAAREKRDEYWAAIADRNAYEEAQARRPATAAVVVDLALHHALLPIDPGLEVAA